MSDWYVEDEPGVLRRVSIAEWTSDYQDQRKVACDDVDGFCVSTVLLGIDHRYGDGLPMIYETMVFDQRAGSASPWLEIYGERYTYKADALAGHARAIEWTKAHVASLDTVNEATAKRGEAMELS